MKIQKIDKRMVGSPDFKYRVSFLLGRNIGVFLDIRQWCKTQFGESIEYELWRLNTYKKYQNEQWSWMLNQHKFPYTSYIFLTSDKELQWFYLHFGDIK